MLIKATLKWALWWYHAAHPSRSEILEIKMKWYINDGLATFCGPLIYHGECLCSLSHDADVITRCRDAAMTGANIREDMVLAKCLGHEIAINEIVMKPAIARAALSTPPERLIYRWWKLTNTLLIISLRSIKQRTPIEAAIEMAAVLSLSIDIRRKHFRVVKWLAK